MTHETIATFLIASALGASAIAQDPINDVIQTTQGTRIRGVEVVEATSETIKYKRGDEVTEMPTTRLVEISWSNPPEEYQLARGALKGGDFATAANMFSEAAGKVGREPFEAECRFQAGTALVRGAGDDEAKAATAAQALTDWLARWPNGYRAPDAMLMLGRAHVAAGNPAQAQTALKRLGDESLAKGWAPIWNARARFELARAQLAAGEFGDARRTFRAATTAARAAAEEGNPSNEVIALQADAAVGIGETLVREGEFDEALSYFDDLATTADGDAIRAAAKAGRGEALYLKSQDAGTQDGLREAQIALAEANMMDSTGGDTTAKALYYSGLVLIALGPERESSTFKQRAVNYFQTVVKEYPDSPWAPLAAEAARQ